METQKCNACLKQLAVVKFAKNRNRKNGFETICKNCRNAARRTKARALGIKTKIRNEHLLEFESGAVVGKQCAQCKLQKLVTDFITLGRSKCRECENNSKLKERYAFSYAAKRAMFLTQGQCCDICKRELKVEKLVVDHCHTTGIVRGLLCRHCNTSLGLLGDGTNLRSMLNAFSYIAKFTAPELIIDILQELLDEHKKNPSNL